MGELITSEMILERIDFSTGWNFERIVSKILMYNGFKNVELTPETNDYGVDVLAEKDDITYAVQCKCYLEPVGNKAVQEVYTGKAYYHKMVAVVITNNIFTKSAIKTAEETQVLLWGRMKLKQLISNLNQSQLQELADFMGLKTLPPEPEPQFLEQLSLFDDIQPIVYPQQTIQTYVQPQQLPQMKPLRYVHEASSVLPHNTADSQSQQLPEIKTPVYVHEISPVYPKNTTDEKQSDNFVKETHDENRMIELDKESENSNILYAFSYLHCFIGVILTITAFCCLSAWIVTLICTCLCSPIIARKIEKKIHSVLLTVIIQILLMCFSLFITIATM